MDEQWAWLVMGVGLGSAAVALVLASRVEAAARRAPPRLTSAWRLSELGTPLVLARRLDGVDVPRDSRVLVAEHVDPAMASTCVVRRGQVPSELAVAADGRRALLFPEGLRAGASALVLTDPALSGRLLALAESAWKGGTPFAERRGLADLVGEPGTPVEAEGRVGQRVVRAGGSILLRLEDAGHSAAVEAPARLAPEALEGQRVRVRGRLARDAAGYPVVAAESIEDLP